MIENCLVVRPLPSVSVFVQHAKCTPGRQHINLNILGRTNEGVIKDRQVHRGGVAAHDATLNWPFGGTLFSTTSFSTPTKKNGDSL